MTLEKSKRIKRQSRHFSYIYPSHPFLHSKCKNFWVEKRCKYTIFYRKPTSKKKKKVENVLFYI